MFTWLQRKEASKRVYLDWAAATPLLPEAKAAMEPYFGEHFANPSAIHAGGSAARQAVETAREQIARAMHLRPETVVFTSGGTESNHLAIAGVIEKRRAETRSYEAIEVITTPLEHPSVRELLKDYVKRGVVVHEVPVDEDGLIQLAALQALVNERTALVTFAYVNSEIGVIQPVRRITRHLRKWAKERGAALFIHIDAAQAPLWIACTDDALPVDLISFDAGKFCGPKGVGILVGRAVRELPAMLHGGGQEAGLRPGTENVPGIVGAATAFVAVQAGVTERVVAVTAVRDYFMSNLKEQIPASVVNGPEGEGRVANNVNISVPGIDTEYAVVVLDHHGIAASTKSACSGAGGGESAVVRAISGAAARAASTIRFTLGPHTTTADVTRAITVLSAHIKSMHTLTNT